MSGIRSGPPCYAETAAQGKGAMFASIEARQSAPQIGGARDPAFRRLQIPTDGRAKYSSLRSTGVSGGARHDEVGSQVPSFHKL